MRYELKNFKGTSNIVQNTPKVETVNTQNQNHRYLQTTPINLSTKYTNTSTSDMYRDNTSTQTQPMQHFEAGTNTNMGSNRFAQTQPMQYSEAGTNTNLPTNRFVQAQPMQYAEASTNTNLPTNRFTQPIHTNIPNQNQISTHNDSCKCEEMEHTGIQYRSDFARQLQQSEAIPNVQPVTNYNSERPRQTESSTIYHIPQ